MEKCSVDQYTVETLSGNQHEDFRLLLRVL